MEDPQSSDTPPENAGRSSQVMEAGSCCRDCGAPLITGSVGDTCGACQVTVPHHGQWPDETVAGIRAPATSPHPPESGKMPKIAGYRLLEKLGEGGFGVVYRAQQLEPVQREVALKVIKPGMDSLEITRRFEAERQALAKMEHPNIAMVLDAGMAENGLPFFVMELVRGEPLTAFCDQRELDLRKRLELFIPVCLAVQHAHQKSILHRDLKPSNILVTEVDGKAVPKVIDFGIVKVLDAAPMDLLQEGQQRTLEGTVIGTPQYMSPEQAGATQDLDTRSDIYTLGVILYELLTGQPPISRDSLRQAALDEILRMIRETEPLRPSSRVLPVSEITRGISIARKSTLRKLNRELQGDLDWITLKALEKERDRRYESAAALAQDLARYLSSEPVAAGPPGALYRIRKLVRRNRLAFAAAAAVFVALLVGVTVSTWQWKVAVRERELKQREFERAENEATTNFTVNEFITKDLLDAAGTENEADRDIKVRTLLDRAAAKISVRFHQQPLIEAQISYTLARCYYTLTEYETALALAQRSSELYQQELGIGHAKSLKSRFLVLDILQSLGRFDTLDQGYKEIVEGLTAAQGAGHPGTILARMNGAVLQMSQGRLEEAETEFRALLSLVERDPGSQDTAIEIQINLGSVLTYQGMQQGSKDKFRQAEEVYRSQLEVLERNQKFPTLTTLNCRNNVATSLINQGKLGEAEQELRATLGLAKQVLGPDNREIVIINEAIASCLAYQSRHDEACRIREAIIAMAERHFEASDPFPFTLRMAVSSHLQSRRSFPRAIQIHENALESYRQKLPPGHRFISRTLKILGGLYEKSGDSGKARAYRREYETLKPLPELPMTPPRREEMDASRPWQVVCFPWPRTTHPCDDLPGWRKCATRDPARSADLPALDFDFSFSGPEKCLPGIGGGRKIGMDNFGIIASASLPLAPGRWRISVEANDGVRVWVNRKLVIDAWDSPLDARYAALVDLPLDDAAEFAVEYFEDQGKAKLKLVMTRE